MIYIAEDLRATALPHTRIDNTRGQRILEVSDLSSLEIEPSIFLSFEGGRPWLDFLPHVGNLC
jgi:hypothetical protein